MLWLFTGYLSAEFVKNVVKSLEFGAKHEISFALHRLNVYNYRAELMGIFMYRVGFR